MQGGPSFAYDNFKPQGPLSTTPTPLLPQSSPVRIASPRGENTLAVQLRSSIELMPSSSVQDPG
ncbi:unnamed protein product [Periconia digitata]|uniref:Uncharacterized protein n=1 Tax=Periconia digitata TaxID=1303443 RepID=A0A9W4UPN2_9PLEO|nr:unnamed protein product [Periconia digitata]